MAKDEMQSGKSKADQQDSVASRFAPTRDAGRRTESPWDKEDSSDQRDQGISQVHDSYEQSDPPTPPQRSEIKGQPHYDKMEMASSADASPEVLGQQPPARRGHVFHPIKARDVSTVIAGNVYYDAGVEFKDRARVHTGSSYHDEITSGASLINRAFAGKVLPQGSRYLTDTRPGLGDIAQISELDEPAVRGPDEDFESIQAEGSTGPSTQLSVLPEGTLPPTQNDEIEDHTHAQQSSARVTVPLLLPDPAASPRASTQFRDDAPCSSPNAALWKQFKKCCNKFNIMTMLVISIVASVSGIVIGKGSEEISRQSLQLTIWRDCIELPEKLANSTQCQAILAAGFDSIAQFPYSPQLHKRGIKCVFDATDPEIEVHVG